MFTHTCRYECNVCKVGVAVYACICTCIYAGMYTCVHPYAGMSACIYRGRQDVYTARVTACTCIYKHVQAGIYTCIYICIYGGVSAYIERG